MKERAWYAEGLHFECQRCGDCCASSPGRVWITEDEIYQVSAYLGMDSDDFCRSHTEMVERRGRCLNERSNFDCIFYNRKEGCVIYPCRPRQCRTWPFWSWNLETPERWRYTAMDCKGIGKGRIHNVEEINNCAEDDGLC